MGSLDLRTVVIYIVSHLPLNWSEDGGVVIVKTADKGGVTSTMTSLVILKFLRFVTKFSEAS